MRPPVLWALALILAAGEAFAAEELIGPTGSSSVSQSYPTAKQADVLAGRFRALLAHDGFVSCPAPAGKDFEMPVLKGSGEVSWYACPKLPELKVAVTVNYQAPAKARFSIFVSKHQPETPEEFWRSATPIYRAAAEQAGLPIPE